MLKCWCFVSLVLVFWTSRCGAVSPTSPIEQQFVASPPGTYALPPIQKAGNGWVFDGNWWPRRLSSFTKGKITLLSFVYTYCTDPLGCPLIYTTMLDVKQRVVSDPTLRDRVRFVSISFDPTNDTPEAMQIYGGKHAKDQSLPWHFLTTFSPYFLTSILEGYGQDIEIETDANGRPTRAIAHMVKVFLIDAEGTVREIYSTAFLHSEVMYHDIKTVALGAAKTSAADKRASGERSFVFRQ